MEQIIIRFILLIRCYIPWEERTADREEVADFLSPIRDFPLICGSSPTQARLRLPGGAGRGVDKWRGEQEKPLGFPNERYLLLIYPC